MAFNVIAFPNQAEQKNEFAIRIQSQDPIGMIPVEPDEIGLGVPAAGRQGVFIIPDLFSAVHLETSDAELLVEDE